VWGVRPLPPPGAAHSPAPALASLAVALGLLAAALAMKARQARKDPLALAVSAAAAGHQQPIITQFTDPDVIRSVMAPPGARTGARYSTAERRVLLGRYTLLTHLGEGGMSDVYTAALTGPEGFRRTFVLKRLKPELAHNRGAVDQFIDEANLGSTLVHPNIVPIFDFGEAGGSYFLAQEYIVGKNLEELIMRHAERMGRGLDAASVFYIAHEILKGLSFAHQKTDEDGEPLRIVHRDISPSNLMISVLGEVKLLDFGIMKAEGRVSRTEMGNVKGNVAFMAPEQARGGVVDARSDIFSLGAVMFHALTNEPFYTGETSTELFYRATVGPTDEHQQRIGRLDPTVARIITKAVSNNPALRYQTADEFAEDLAVEVNAAAARELSALIHALFGAELRPVNGISGGGGRGGGTGLPRKPATL
jgi:serine/threonine-protein kinase